MRRQAATDYRPLRHLLLATPLVLFCATCIIAAVLHGSAGSDGTVVRITDKARSSSLAASGGRSVTCDVRREAWQDRCEYVRQHAEVCSPDDGLISYLELAYCYTPKWPALGAALISGWLLLLFSIMMATAEHFFCPALEELSDWLGMPDHLAGATLMAFGNGASDVFTMVAALSAEDGDAGMSTALSEALSSGMFVANVVLGCALLFAPAHPIGIGRAAFLSDVLFYLGAVLLVFFISIDSRVHLAEGLALFGYYLLYLVHTIRVSRGQPSMHAPHPDPLIHHEIPHTHHLLSFLSSDLEALDEAMPLEAPLLARQNTQPLSRNSSSRAVLGGNSGRSITNGVGAGSGAGQRPTGPSRQVSNISQVVVEQLGAFGRAREACERPLVLMLRLFMPQVDPQAKYPRWCAALVPLVGPCLWLLATHTPPWQLGRAGMAYALGLGTLASGLVYSAYPADGRSFGPFPGVFAITAFVQAMTLLSLASSELMAACGALGTMAGLPRPFLAATLMAWGNSLQDLVSNVTMSASGFPLVALTACLAAPLFNLLTGLGLGVTLHCLQFGTLEAIEVSNGVLLLFAAHVCLLVRYAIEVPVLRKYMVPRATGAISLLAWTALTPLYVLTSTGIIFNDPWLASGGGK